VTFFARQRFRTHYDRYGIEAFRWFASRHDVVTGDEW
jgi:hypothetical protein